MLALILYLIHNHFALSCSKLFWNGKTWRWEFISFSFNMIRLVQPKLNLMLSILAQFPNRSPHLNFLKIILNKWKQLRISKQIGLIWIWMSININLIVTFHWNFRNVFIILLPSWWLYSIYFIIFSCYFLLIYF